MIRNIFLTVTGLTALLVLLGICFFTGDPNSPGEENPDRLRNQEAEPIPAAKRQIQNPLKNQPLYFEANQGQCDATVKFLSRGKGFVLFLASEGTVFTFRNLDLGFRVENELRQADLNQQSEIRNHQSAAVHMHLVNANAPGTIEGLNPLPTRVNYFIGNDPAKWRSGVPTFARVAYREIYPGIDLIYYGNPGEVEFDFLVSPGADPERIELAFEGTDSLEFTEEGALLLHAQHSVLQVLPPRIFQEINSVKHPVDGHYVFRGKNRVGFELASYAVAYPLVIDPVLSFSSYLGGSANDRATDVAVDGSGNMYVCGYTLSADFPTTSGAFDETHNLGFDAFIVKVDTASGMIDYATYLGGSGDDRALGMDVNGSGQVFITGRAWSGDFPTTPGAYQTTPSPAGDAFVTKLNTGGTSLVYSTYLGANGVEEGGDVAVDGQGIAHVVGNTGSTDFPVTANAFQQTPGGFGDAFLVRFSSSGNQLIYATYLGGNGIDEANGVATDASNRSYITGITYSTDFPTTGGAFQSNKPGGQFDSEGFAARFNSGGTVSYVTYLGGNGDDAGYGIAVDGSGNAYITGQTASADFPTVGAFQSNLSGSADGFTTKFTSSGSSVSYSTYLGGSGSEAGRGIVVDAQNRAYVAGITNSSNFPIQDAIQPSLAGGTDGFITRFTSSGDMLEFSSYFGGSAGDTARAIALDGDGNMYLSGYTASADFPTLNPFQPNSAGALDAFLSWIAADVAVFPDCNNNGVPDSLDIANGTSQDCNNNGVPDECDIGGISDDCNGNGIPDECDIAGGTSPDCNNDGIPDECQLIGNDCNNNGIPDDCDIAMGTSNDCNNDGVPDECQLVGNDCNNNGIPDDCEGPDCNQNGILDECEALINPLPADTMTSIYLAPNHDHSSEPVCGMVNPALSADGRFIAFESGANNLIPGDGNGVSDIFVYDTWTGILERVSVSNSGMEANGASYCPTISDDGTLVAFTSDADNLVPNDLNGFADVFVHNRQTGVTERVNISSNGDEANGITLNAPMISGDGRFVVFSSLATNLIPNDSTFNEEMFVRDLPNGITARPVAFNDNTFEIFASSISQSGRFLGFSVPDQPELDSLDTNFDWDIYIHDRDPDENGTFDEGNGITELVTVSDSGEIGNNNSFSQPYISADGQFVVYASQATNLIANDANGTISDLFVRNRQTDTNELVTISTGGQQANDFTFAFFGKYMSDDGRFVVFATAADNLVTNDTNGAQDIFLRDRLNGTTIRISRSGSGAEANGASFTPAINTNGQYSVFSSPADNLIPGDIDNVSDIFVVQNDIVTGIKENEGGKSPVQSFLLHQNYPNPFNPTTNVEFGLPNAEWVKLVIYDVVGREVKMLVNKRLPAGKHTVQWDGTNDAGEPVASGVYLYRLKITIPSKGESREVSQTRKMLLVR